MKSISYILILLVVLTFIISCQKEIDITVEDAEPQTVVEAVLSNEQGSSMVKLTKSIKLNQVTEYPKVEGAEVSLKLMETGEVYTLTELEKGVYTKPNVIGKVGNSYELKILQKNGKEIKSISKIPTLVSLEKVEYEIIEDSGSFQDTESLKSIKFIPIFKDPKGEENYYQFLVYSSRDNDANLFVTRDIGFDGLENSQRFVLSVAKGDTISIQMNNITKKIYEYLNGMIQNINQATATPTNPPPFFENALGYFSTYSNGGKVEVIIQ